MLFVRRFASNKIIALFNEYCVAARELNYLVKEIVLLNASEGILLR